MNKKGSITVSAVLLVFRCLVGTNLVIAALLTPSFRVHKAVAQCQKDYGYTKEVCKVEIAKMTPAEVLDYIRDDKVVPQYKMMPSIAPERVKNIALGSIY